jgi:hypothetical protein
MTPQFDHLRTRLPQYCNLTMIRKLLHIGPSRIPVELLVALEPFREDWEGSRVRYRDCPELRTLLRELLEERARHRNFQVRNAMQNWRELSEMVTTGQFFREAFAL